MLKRGLIFLIFNFMFIFSKNIEHNSYNSFIEEYPKFKKTNFFEDNNYYYYLSKFDIDNKKINSSKSKSRLMSISDFTQSICCGFDVKILDNVREFKIIENNSNSTISYNIASKSTYINDIVYLYNELNNDIGLLAMKILKTDINPNQNCDCRIKIK